jgi:hypothetical protein
VQPDEMTPPAVMSVREYAAATGQTAAAVREQIKNGTFPATAVILRKPAREGGRPRYGILRASVDKLLGNEASP